MIVPYSVLLRIELVVEAYLTTNSIDNTHYSLYQDVQNLQANEHNVHTSLLIPLKQIKDLQDPLIQKSMKRVSSQQTYIMNEMNILTEIEL